MCCHPERNKMFGVVAMRRRCFEGERLMSASERYRRYAAECLRLAQSAGAPADKTMLVEMADRWVRLAEQVERAEKPTSEK